MSRYDVIVLGLGGMGSAALYHLAARRKRVLGLEAFTAAHDRGSSHGESRIIRQAYFEDQAYVPLLLRAYELWHDLEKTTGQDLLLITGGLMMGAPECDIFHGSVRSALAHDLPHQVWDAEGIRRRFPVLNPDPEEMALFEEKAGVLFPEACIRAHLGAASAAGADARFNEPVLEWAPTGGGVRVTTPKGSYEAERLVVTAGPWARQMLESLGLPLWVERQVLHWFARPQQKGFALGQLPIYIWQHQDNTVFYGFPALGEAGVKVAFHHGGEPADPDDLRREVTPEEQERIRSHVGRYVPALGSSALLRSQVCMYTNSPDDHFVIGLHPEHPQVSMAAGFSGHGFKFCPVVGEVLADLACQGGTGHSIDLFSPNRFART